LFIYYIVLKIMFTSKITLQWLQRLQIYAFRERILLITCIAMVKLVLNYARSSGKNPSHEVQPHSMFIFSLASCSQTQATVTALQKETTFHIHLI